MHTPAAAWTHRLPTPLRILCEHAAFALILAILGVVFLSASAFGAVMVCVLPLRWQAPCGQAVIRGGFRLSLLCMRATGLVRLDLSALDALQNERGLVIAPNHPSLLDVMLVASRVPHVVCITKAGLWDNPLLGGSARLAGYIRNDAPLPLVRRAGAALRNGANLLIFPEGTRTPRPPVGPFKGGFALMARNAGADVQTVFIEANTDYLRKGWPLFRMPPLPLAYRVRLGRRFSVDGPLDAAMERLEAYYAAELGG